VQQLQSQKPEGAAHNAQERLLQTQNRLLQRDSPSSGAQRACNGWDRSLG
jgi:hypothetical protein